MFFLNLFSFLLQPLNGVFTSYYQIMLRNMGYSYSLVGLIIGFGTVSTIIIPFFAGPIAEKTGSEKLVMIFAAILTAAPMVPFATGARVWVIGVCLFISMGAFWVLMGIADGFITKSLGGDSGKYGVVRGIGTAGYVFFLSLMAFVGFPNSESNVQIVINQCVFVTAVILALSFCKSPKKTAPVVGKVNFSEKKAFSFSWFKPSFWLFIFIVGIFKFAVALPDRFLSSFITEELGYGSSFILFIALGAFGEIFVLVFGGKFAQKHNIKPLTLVCVSFVGMAIRFILLHFSTNLPVFILAQLMHALCFAPNHLGAVKYISENVKYEHSTLAFTIYWVFAGNLATLLASFTSGFAIDAFGYYNLFLYSAVIPLAGLVLALVCKKKIESN